MSTNYVNAIPNYVNFASNPANFAELLFFVKQYVKIKLKT